MTPASCRYTPTSVSYTHLLVHNRIVHDLLRVAVEHDLAVHALCQHAETEYLAQRTCDSRCV